MIAEPVSGVDSPRSAVSCLRESLLGLKRNAMAALDASQGLVGIFEGMQRAFAAPASWESTVIATTTIFVIAAPVLFAGLSAPGVLSAFVLGLFTFRAFGGQGTIVVFLYFLIGTAATKVNYKLKKAEGTAEKRGGRRGPGSVWGSGTAGTLCAIATIYGVGGPAWVSLWRLGFLASFCTKLSDTMGSEIGKAFGKTTYLVTTMSVVPRGTDGAVSVVGTFAGVVASIFLAFIGCIITMTDVSGAVICVVAAQVANMCESFIGAAFQDQKGFEWITNDISNIFNILIGATLAILTRLLIG